MLAGPGGERVSFGAAARSAGDLGFVEEVWVQVAAGAGDLEADEAAVLPVERDEGPGAGRGAGLDGGAARRDWAPAAFILAPGAVMPARWS
jgi:hypothetical protein